MSSSSKLIDNGVKIMIRKKSIEGKATVIRRSQITAGIKTRYQNSR